MSEEGKRLIAATSHSLEQTGKIGGAFQVTQDPPFLGERVALFEQFYNEYQAQLQAKPREAITITLPDGNTKEGVSWETTPLDIAKGIHRKLAERCVVAKVRYLRRIGAEEGLVAADEHEEESHEQDENWELIDMMRPLEGDCHLQLIDFEEKEGKTTFWHSSAHILGASIEQTFGAYLCTGPPINPGFFYDAYVGDNGISQDHFESLKKSAESLIASKSPFQRIVLSKEQALQMFAYNPFKVQLISSKIPDGGKTTAYRCGYFIDLCTGPHVPSTSNIKAFAITKNSSAYWLGKAENDSLQRVYGVSYPEKKQLAEYIKFQEEAAKRDHRNIGKHQELFFWHPFSPGSTFFLPHGAVVYNRLIEFIRSEYRVRGFNEVITPNIYNLDLWKTSGHYQNYKDAMFLFTVENQEFGMKPMNCPGHCLMFQHASRSYKELPIRMADFGVLHRNELSGALTGLTRVRRFQQDDAHIFCRKDQVTEEVWQCLDFLRYIYDSMGFQYEFELSTRPAKALGGPEIWEPAEAALADALNRLQMPWRLNPGDGAFYGPKIDIQLYDALKRKHQCGTIQLDFNLPIRFDLSYRTENLEEQQRVPVEYGDFVEKPLKPGYDRPIIIHRAILGSVERMIAILTENFAGKWPFWLSPRQIAVLPISEQFNEYADAVGNRLQIEGYSVNVDKSNMTLNKRIRNSQLEQYNFILVVGAEEVATQTVDIRPRDSNRSIGKQSIPQFLEYLISLRPEKSQAYRDFMSRSAGGDVIEVKETISLTDLNQKLEHQTFLSGDDLGDTDWRIFNAFSNEPDPERFPHVRRWWAHLKSLAQTQCSF